MEKVQLIFATGNENKMKEVRLILADLNIKLLSLKEAGITIDIEEDGTTFLENSEIKAKAIWNQTGGIVMADDSGLVVDYIGGEPGVYSARYLGEDSSYDRKNQSILERLKQARGNERSARFVCHITVICHDGQVVHTEGAMEGLIAEKPEGDAGFGYDPIMYLPQYKKTAAQLPIEIKNEISHRGKALKAMKQKLSELYGGKYYEDINCK